MKTDYYCIIEPLSTFLSVSENKKGTEVCFHFIQITWFVPTTASLFAQLYYTKDFSGHGT